MSDLDCAMMEHICYIVHEEHRPFSHRDLLRFTVDEKEYKIAHGTFRNKISQLMREGKVELAYNAGIALYTLKGITFGKPKFTMTPNHTGVPLQDPIIKLIKSLPMDRGALHDIRLRFNVPGIWSILSTGSQLMVDPISKDIMLQTCEIDGLLIR
ncbi:MAG TPA: hypothetical protein VI278_17130, partial [Nitrososphaeraceae archaeon]